MKNEIAAEMSPTAEYKLGPEHLSFSQEYLKTLDVSKACFALGIEVEEGLHMLRKPEVKRFVDSIMMEQGYSNSNKLVALLDDVIRSKLEEAEETGIYTQKDLIDILTLQHKISQDKVNADIARSKSGTGVAVQINNNLESSNLGKLISSLVEDVS